jgi:hypothetical protein
MASHDEDRVLGTIYWTIIPQNLTSEIPMTVRERRECFDWLNPWAELNFMSTLNQWGYLF